MSIIYSSTVIWFPWNLEIGDWSAIGEETLIYNLGKVTIGEKATVSHRVHVCAGTHDYTVPALPLLVPKSVSAIKHGFALIHSSVLI